MDLAEKKINHPPDDSQSQDFILYDVLTIFNFPPSETEKGSGICSTLIEDLHQAKVKVEVKNLPYIIQLLEKSSCDFQEKLFILIEGIAEKSVDAWIVFEQMLSTGNALINNHILDIINKLIFAGSFLPDSRAVTFFAHKCNIESSTFSSSESLEKIFNIFNLLPENGHDSLLLSVYLNYKERGLQFFAAKLFDIKGIPVPDDIIYRVLGEDYAKTLFPYLIYTRASYQELLDIKPDVNVAPPIVDSIRECIKSCNESLLKEVIAKLGWKNVVYGLIVKRYAAITCGNSLPLHLYIKEAALFEKYAGFRRQSEYLVFTAYGGITYEPPAEGNNIKPVQLFKSYNLAHANLLRDLLDVAPLHVKKIKNIITQLDDIVTDFITLFSAYTDECKIIPDIYHDIKQKIISEVKNYSSDEQISADITRLVQMFEDPHNIGEVHSLHGMKRYLHQKGLQLGFKLVDQSKSPNRNVSLLLVEGTRIISLIKKIKYADFEPADNEGFSYLNIPYNIKVVIDGFKRQMLHGLDNFPLVNIFSYGNEVHYFVWFRNHPVFIRIDYSPPLQGGMIDLQYFGVSNYEVADHPNLSLDAIRYFFQHLEFDVKLNGTHIQARYDKERAFNLMQLCDKVEYLFCLAPYLMDLDWVIGSLNLDPAAKQKVILAWAENFLRWGVLPINKLLTNDRLNIIKEVLISPEGEKELIWTGEEKYQDLYTVQFPSATFKEFIQSIKFLELDISEIPEMNWSETGQLHLEKIFINIIRSAIKSSEIRENNSGFERTPKDLFFRYHECEWFAECIHYAKSEFVDSTDLARIIMPLEQFLKFQTTGTLESFKVQKAILPLKGFSIIIYILRDHKGIIRMAIYSKDRFIYSRRSRNNEPWISNVCLSSTLLLSLLRENNYTVTGLELQRSTPDDLQNIKNELSIPFKIESSNPLPEEKIVKGMQASPGKISGSVLLGYEKRLPEDFNDKIFVSPSISPDENTILYHSAGIVSTGGGILSHAGLIAAQFNKPAIIIPGKWITDSSGSLILNVNTSVYKSESKKVQGYNLTIRYNIGNKHYQIMDGDLVFLNADTGTLEILGRERNIISLNENFKSLGRINQQLSRESNPEEILKIRGKKIHIRHQLEKTLLCMKDPVFARYAVREILSGNFLSGNTPADEKSYLMKLLLQNGNFGDSIQIFIRDEGTKIENKFIQVLNNAVVNIPSAGYLFEVVITRLEVFRLYDIIDNLNKILKNLSLQEIFIDTGELEKIERISRKKLDNLRISLNNKLISTEGKKEFLEHQFIELSRINELLNESCPEPILRMEKNYKSSLLLSIKRNSEKFVIRSDDGSLELSSSIGWKASNLAEVEKLGGKDLIPPWFVISDKAFQYFLNSGIDDTVTISGQVLRKGKPLIEIINIMVNETSFDNNEKSLMIRKLWSAVSVPDQIKDEIINAYNEICKESISEKDNNFFVALRSSSCEEDAEIAARAGEFETYLFISGKEQLIETLKKTWSGLWTERAIHNRYVLGNPNTGIKGGVIVQKMIRSRVSGVMQTINIAKGELKEMVINAGLGLGEGIVSGIASADQIIVSKEGNLDRGPIHFNYITSDKTGQVVFNKKLGTGTLFTSTLYHQRFRPALEYVELCELVAIAAKLESAYGYPLDIEFAIEGTKLWILQVRPVAVFLPALQETIKRYPLETSKFFWEK